MKFFQVDAFTKGKPRVCANLGHNVDCNIVAYCIVSILVRFGGNPAAICLVNESDAVDVEMYVFALLNICVSFYE